VQLQLRIDELMHHCIPGQGTNYPANTGLSPFIGQQGFLLRSVAKSRSAIGCASSSSRKGSIALKWQNLSMVAEHKQTQIAQHAIAHKITHYGQARLVCLLFLSDISLEYFLFIYGK
jgi:hypothetical protein